VTKLVQSGIRVVPTTCCSRTGGKRSVVQQKQWKFSVRARTKNTTDDKNSLNFYTSLSVFYIKFVCSCRSKQQYFSYFDLWCKKYTSSRNSAHKSVTSRWPANWNFGWAVISLIICGIARSGGEENVWCDRPVHRSPRGGKMGPKWKFWKKNICLQHVCKIFGQINRKN